MAEALNVPAGTTVSTGGNRVWLVTTAQSQDGTSARSGAIGHNQTSWLQITVSGPATVTYWRRVSTEPDFDFLRVYDNGTELPALRLSGEFPWAQQSLVLGSGSHTVRWQFSKDEADDEAGQNTVWIDQIGISSVNQGPPQITQQPARLGVEVGAPFMLSVTAVGEGPLQYLWRRDGQPLPTQTGQQLQMAAFTTDMVGAYDCVVTNTLNSATSATADVSFISLGPTLGDSTRHWYATGSQFWGAEEFAGASAGTALRSGVIGDAQESGIRSTFQGPGVLQYWQRVSTEDNFDWLVVRVDGVVTRQTSGEREWELVQITLPTGSHEVSWNYEKNVRFSGGDDAVWLEQVRFLPGQASWREQYFTVAQLADSSVSGWPADADGNGFSNAFEYLYGRNPLSFQPSPQSCLVPLIVGEHDPASGISPAQIGAEITLPATLPADALLYFEHTAVLDAGAVWVTLAQKSGNAAWQAVNGGVLEPPQTVGGSVKLRVCLQSSSSQAAFAGFFRLRLALPGS